jgi:hypothetical protein
VRYETARAVPSAYGDRDVHRGDYAVTNCQANVYDRFMFGSFRQCERKAVKDGFCKQHHPDAEKARRDKTKQREDKEWRHRRLELAGPKFYTILKEIAALEDVNCDEAPGRAQRAIAEFEKGSV